MDSVGNYFRSQGNTGAGDATQLMSGALTGAATGTMFGPAGIAIGAALGGLADAFQILTRRTVELTNAFEN
jgi:phage tail tape-measure protein